MVLTVKTTQIGKANSSVKHPWNITPELEIR
jgi:hypothetical protein